MVNTTMLYSHMEAQSMADLVFGYPNQVTANIYTPLMLLTIFGISFANFQSNHNNYVAFAGSSWISFISATLMLVLDVLSVQVWFLSLVAVGVAMGVNMKNGRF